MVVSVPSARNIQGKPDQDIRGVAGLYYQIKDADNCDRFIVFADGDQCPDLSVPVKAKLPKTLDDENSAIFTFDDVIHTSLSHIERYVDTMEQGYFQHTKDPTNDKCRSHCAFKRICRKDKAKLLAWAD